MRPVRATTLSNVRGRPSSLGWTATVLRFQMFLLRKFSIFEMIFQFLRQSFADTTNLQFCLYPTLRPNRRHPIIKPFSVSTAEVDEDECGGPRSHKWVPPIAADSASTGQLSPFTSMQSTPCRRWPALALTVGPRRFPCPAIAAKSIVAISFPQ